MSSEQTSAVLMSVALIQSTLVNFLVSKGVLTKSDVEDYKAMLRDLGEEFVGYCDEETMN